MRLSEFSFPVPTYLHGRPRNVILHFLDRIGSSNKFTSEDIEDVKVYSQCTVLKARYIL